RGWLFARNLIETQRTEVDRSLRRRRRIEMSEATQPGDEPRPIQSLPTPFFPVFCLFLAAPSTWRQVLLDKMPIYVCHCQPKWGNGMVVPSIKQYKRVIRREPTLISKGLIVDGCGEYSGDPWFLRIGI